MYLLPANEISGPCSFFLKLFQASVLLDCGERERRELMRNIGRQLEEATVADLLIRAPAGETTIYNVDVVRDLVEEFVKQEQNALPDSPEESEFQEIKGTRSISNVSKMKVAKLIDGYLDEVARDPNLPRSKFVDLADIVSSFSRPTHDGIYRAIDMYIKEHPGIIKSERKRICKLMECKKLSAYACVHAVQNERLPLRVVVQVLFLEQIRATSSGSGGGSSRSTTTNTEDYWDAMPTVEEHKAMKGELVTLLLRDEGNVNDGTKTNGEKIAYSKVKRVLISEQIFSKLWSNKERQSDHSSSDLSEDIAFTQETKSDSFKK